MAGERGNGMLSPSCGGLRVDLALHASETGLGFWLGESLTFMVLSKEAPINSPATYFNISWGGGHLTRVDPHPVKPGGACLRSGSGRDLPPEVVVLLCRWCEALGGGRERGERQESEVGHC